ncbi:hypothetical protein D4T97_009170 [Siminovitchia acidinfaciens]|uniref:Uncharacterized protein n=1 Tax=Siminovitchia acidinfaciens TaxID=2321395 RepID=A0A429Y2C5_9BACI|nr:hypothetical protein [Siminovitchia acidinfaciens]RST75402.1 hypothetical protein D4T97_009170 [Siminovitchia acidinfaciens]
MLTYENIKEILPETKGVSDAAISFGCIAFTCSEKQLKGLFIQTGKDDDLQAAITNGAVAAVWKSDEELPFYTPNHFPVFLSEEEPLSAVIQILGNYRNKMSLTETDKKTWLKFPIDGRVPEDLVKKMEQMIQPPGNTSGTGRDEE